MSKPAIEISGLVKTFGDFRALDGLDLEVATGRGARLPRPQRRGQVHDDPRAARAAARRRRQRPAARRRPVARRGRAAPPARLRARRRQPVAEPDRRRGDRPARHAARRPRPRAPRRRCSSASSSTRPRRAAPTRRATGRRSRSSPRSPPTPSCSCSTSRPRASTRSWRRSSRRCIARNARRGPDGAALEPHPRRGRGAVRPGEHHPRRPDGRDRHAGRAAPPHPHVDRRRDACEPRRASTQLPGVHDLHVEDHRARFDVDTAQLDEIAAPRSPASACAA